MTEEVRPNNPTAELALIGACIDRAEFIPLAVEMVQPGDFYKQTHQWVWEAITALHRRSVGVDTVTLADELAKAGHLEELRGATALVKSIDHCPNPFNWREYAAIVQKLAIARKTLDELANASAEMIEPGADADAIAAKLVQKLLEKRQAKGGIHYLGDVTTSAKKQMHDISEGKMPDGIDPVLQPLREGLPFSILPKKTMTLIGADPGMGKSFLGLLMALGNALLGKRCLLVSTEMPLDQLALRIVPMLANLGPYLKDSKLQGFQHASITNRLLLSGDPVDAAEAEHLIDILEATLQELVDAHVLTIMDGSENIDQVLADIRAEEFRYGPFDLEVFDYVQMFEAEVEGRNVNQTQMETVVAERLRQHAMGSEACIVGISSFAKGKVNGRAGKEQFRGSYELAYKAMYMFVIEPDEELLDAWKANHIMDYEQSLWDGRCLKCVKARGTSVDGSLLDKGPIPIRINKQTGIIETVRLRDDET